MDNSFNNSCDFINRLPLGIVILDSEGNVKANSELAFEFLGISIEDLLTNTFGQAVKNEELRRALLQVHEGSTGKQDVCFTSQGREIKCTLIRNFEPSTKENEITIIVEDATQFKKMESVKHEFIESILHRIRNPLTTLKTSLSLLNADKIVPIPIELKEIINMSYREANRLHVLLDDLRNLFFVEIGLAEKELEIEEFEIAQALGRALEQLQKLPSPFKEVKSRMNVTGDMDSKVKADFEKTRQIIMVLLKNALIYSPEEKVIQFCISRINGSVQIQVVDQGVGISEDNKPYIFTKYFREDNSINRENEGSGLGLFVIKSYIELMKGTIYFETGKGEGSTFTITLPAAE